MHWCVIMDWELQKYKNCKLFLKSILGKNALCIVLESMIDNFLSFSRYFKGDCYTASSANYKIRQYGELVENSPKKSQPLNIWWWNSGTFYFISGISGISRVKRDYQRLYFFFLFAKKKGKKIKCTASITQWKSWLWLTSSLI